jgi:hypothetical protein
MAVHSTFSRNWICKTEYLEMPSVHNYFTLLLYKSKLILYINIRVLNVTMCITSTNNKNYTFLSGFAISGNMLQNGFMTSRNFTENKKKCQLYTIFLSPVQLICTLPFSTVELILT